jgi:flagellar biosynthesis protein FlhF
MIIKSFMAETVAGALKMVKEELGGSAVILKTRVCNASETATTGNRVEVTACVDESAVAGTKGKLPAGISSGRKTIKLKSVPPKTVRKNPKSDFASKLEKKLDAILNSHYASEPMGNIDPRVKSIYLTLLDADIPVEIARQQIRVIEGRLGFEDDVELLAADILQKELSDSVVAEVPIKAGMKILFAGTSGVGKTSILAKMAADLSVRKGIRVTLASLDNVKVAAYEEIGGYAEMLNVPLDTSGEPEKNHRKDAVLLIDTPPLIMLEGIHSSLSEKIRAIKPDILFLVFSAGARSRDLVDMMAQFEEIGPTHLIVSHLDESVRWGGILTMTKYLDIPLALISDSPGGIGTLRAPDSRAIARKILKISGGAGDE